MEVVVGIGILIASGLFGFAFRSKKHQKELDKRQQIIEDQKKKV